MLRQVLLACGALSSLLYLAMNVFVPMQYEGYSSVSQTVSELSAVGAPTRPLWVSLAILYSLLLAAFGWGVWTSAGHERRLRVVGALMIAQAIVGLAWPPMQMRGEPFAMTDALHIAFAFVTLAFMLAGMGLGAAALGPWFRLYTAATIVIFLAFGALTGLEAPAIAANEPTPWIGIWERINIAAYMSWVMVLSIALLYASPSRSSSSRRRGQERRPAASPG